MGGIFAAGIPIGRTFKLVEALFRRQFGRYRLGDDCGCLGTVDDASRAGFILRRYGAEKKPALDDDAQLFHRDIGGHPLGRRRLFFSVHAGKCLYRRFGACIFKRDADRRYRTDADRVAQCADCSRTGIYVFSDDVCHYFDRHYYRRVCRTDEIFGNDAVFGHMVFIGLCAGRALGVGRRLYEQGRRIGLCRRYGGAHQCRYRGTRRRLGFGQAHRLRARGDASAQYGDDTDRRGNVVVRLVRL
ncbi:Uncharacterised protein [Neisseria meningitidis]|nr:Uncharacterised protein [Neisseria meningitidis]CWQ71442.1 Uncharacterised protein [Neisseria meningitidis]